MRVSRGVGLRRVQNASRTQIEENGAFPFCSSFLCSMTFVHLSKRRSETWWCHWSPHHSGSSHWGGESNKDGHWVNGFVVATFLSVAVNANGRNLQLIRVTLQSKLQYYITLINVLRVIPELRVEWLTGWLLVLSVALMVWVMKGKWWERIDFLALQPWGIELFFLILLHPHRPSSSFVPFLIGSQRNGHSSSSRVPNGHGQGPKKA